MNAFLHSGRAYRLNTRTGTGDVSSLSSSSPSSPVVRPSTVCISIAETAMNIYRQRNDNDQSHLTLDGTYLTQLTEYCATSICNSRKGRSPIGLLHAPPNMTAAIRVLHQEAVHDAMYPPPTSRPLPCEFPSRLLYNNPVCFLTTLVPVPSVDATESTSLSIPKVDATRPEAEANLKVVKSSKESKVDDISPLSSAAAAAAHQRNSNSKHLHIMTVSWLTCIDNNGNFFMSINQKRTTASSFMDNNEDQYFTLSIAVEGQEHDLILCGSTSGPDKINRLQLTQQMVPPGWCENTTTATKTTKASKASKTTTTTKKLKQKHVQKKKELEKIAALGLKCHARSFGHLVCKVISVTKVHEHLHITASIIEGYVRPEYARSSSDEGPLVYTGQRGTNRRSMPSALSFLGSKIFQSYR